MRTCGFRYWQKYAQKHLSNSPLLRVQPVSNARVFLQERLREHRAAGPAVPAALVGPGPAGVDQQAPQDVRQVPLSGVPARQELLLSAEEERRSPVRAMDGPI